MMWHYQVLLFSCFVPFTKAKLKPSSLQDALEYFSLAQVALYNCPQRTKSLRNLGATWKLSEREAISRHRRHALLCYNEGLSLTYVKNIVQAFDKIIILCNETCAAAMDQVRSDVGQLVYFFDYNSNITFESYFLKQDLRVTNEVSKAKSKSLLLNEENSFVKRRMDLRGVELLTLVEAQPPYLMYTKNESDRYSNQTPEVIILTYSPTNTGTN